MKLTTLLTSAAAVAAMTLGGVTTISAESTLDIVKKRGIYAARLANLHPAIITSTPRAKGRRVEIHATFSRCLRADCRQDYCL